jgi:hypothetical protein
MSQHGPLPDELACPPGSMMPASTSPSAETDRSCASRHSQ